MVNKDLKRSGDADGSTLGMSANHSIDEADRFTPRFSWLYVSFFAKYICCKLDLFFFL